MRFYEILTEKTAKPDKLETLRKYKGMGYFGSFTHEDKIGINPNSKYSTPVGIYCYPLDYIINYIDQREELNIIAEFMGESNPNFLWIIKPKEGVKTIVIDKEESNIDPEIMEKVFNLSVEYHKKHENYYKELQAYYDLPRDERPKSEPRMHEDFKETRMTYIMNDFFKENAADIFLYKKLSGKRFYSDIIKQFSYFNSDARDAEDENEEIQKKSRVQPSAIEANKFLRKLGIGFVVDHGTGYIHISEKNQAFFTSLSALEVVEKILLHKNDRIDTPEYTPSADGVTFFKNRGGGALTGLKRPLVFRLCKEADVINSYPEQLRLMMISNIFVVEYLIRNNYNFALQEDKDLLTLASQMVDNAFRHKDIAYKNIVYKYFDIITPILKDKQLGGSYGASTQSPLFERYIQLLKDINYTPPSHGYDSWLKKYL